MDFDDANKENWSTYIPLVNRILNAHVHSAIGIFPYELLFGSEVARDMHMLKSDLPTYKSSLSKMDSEGRGQTHMSEPSTKRCLELITML